MLIPSERHRSEDLSLWAEMEAADYVHGERLERSGKIARSLDAIVQFSAGGACYAGWSGGKDSTVLAHLIWRAAVGVPLFHVNAHPVANPDVPRVRESLLPLISGTEYRTVQITYDCPLTNSADDSNRFFAAFRYAGNRYISGIRADESGGRVIRMRRYGLMSKNTCAPLGWWTAADAFGYLAHHNLPVHPAYAMLGGGRWERHQIRVDELAGAGGDSLGRKEWEAEYYGDVLRRLDRGR